MNYLLPGKRPVENDLSSRLKNILFPPEGAKIASKDHRLFQMVMSEFYCFEEEVLNYVIQFQNVLINSSVFNLQGREHSEGSIALAMLTERCKETFHDDFPLYMAIIHRTLGNL